MQTSRAGGGRTLPPDIFYGYVENDMHLCAVSPEVGTRMAGDASSVTSRVCSGEAFSEQSVLKEAAFSRPEPYSFLLDGRNGASVFSKSFAHATGRRRRERADARRKKSREGIRAEVSPGRTERTRVTKAVFRRGGSAAVSPQGTFLPETLLPRRGGEGGRIRGGDGLRYECLERMSFSVGRAPFQQVRCVSVCAVGADSGRSVLAPSFS